MDEDCEYVRSSYLVKEDPAWSQLEDRLDILVGTEINSCRETAIDELETLEFSPHATNEERVKRILYLLQKDILGSYLGSLILEKKFQRDAFYQNNIEFPSYAHLFAGHPLTQRHLVLLAVTSTLFAFAMLGYLLSFALIQTPQRQRAWVSSFIIWLVLDFVLVSTFEALLTNVAIPSMIFADVDVMKKQTAELSRHYDEKATASAEKKIEERVPTPPSQSPTKSVLKKKQHSLPFLDVKSRDDVVAFNSAHFFSVANRIAKYYAEQNESRFALAYASFLAPGSEVKATWMRPLFHLIKRVDDAHTKRVKTIPKGSAYVPAAYPSIFGDEILNVQSFYIVKTFLLYSSFVQDAIMQLVVTSLLFFLLLLHVQLYNVLPALVLLPLALVVGALSVYIIIRAGTALFKYINSWNQKRIAPFSQKAIKVLEADEFVGEMEMEEDPTHDDGEIFEDFTGPPPPLHRAAIRLTLKAQPKQEPSPVPQPHYSNMAMVRPFEEPQVLTIHTDDKPHRHHDDSSDSANDEKSDSSASSTDSDEHQYPSNGPRKYNKNDMTVQDFEEAPVRVVNKLKARTKLPVHPTPTKASLGHGQPSPTRSAFGRSQPSPLRAAPGRSNPSPSRSNASPSPQRAGAGARNMFYTPSKEKAAPLSRAERLMNLAND